MRRATVFTSGAMLLQAGGCAIDTNALLGQGVNLVINAVLNGLLGGVVV